MIRPRSSIEIVGFEMATFRENRRESQENRPPNARSVQIQESFEEHGNALTYDLTPKWYREALPSGRACSAEDMP